MPVSTETICQLLPVSSAARSAMRMFGASGGRPRRLPYRASAFEPGLGVLTGLLTLELGMVISLAVAAEDFRPPSTAMAAVVQARYGALEPKPIERAGRAI